MPGRRMTFDVVRKMGLELPGVEEGTAYGTAALKVHGKMFACLPTHRSAEPDSLAVRIDFDHRAQLIAADPDTYYVKDHYVNYPCVLVRLSRVHQDALRDLLLMAWRFVSASKRAPRRKNPKPIARTTRR